MNPQTEKIINTLSLSELITLNEEIQAIIASKQKEEKSRLLVVFSEMAEKAGLSVTEVTASLHATTHRQDEEREDKRRNPARPKYRNPADGQTWTGRGRKPLWVADYLREKGWKEAEEGATEEVRTRAKSSNPGGSLLTAYRAFLLPRIIPNFPQPRILLLHGCLFGLVAAGFLLLLAALLYLKRLCILERKILL